MTRLIRIIALATVAGLSALWPAYASANATLTVSGAESQRMDQSWDIGPLQIAISVSNYQFVETIYYGQYSTPASLASQIAGAFSRDYLQNGLCAIAKGTVVTFHLKNSATFGLVTIAGSTDSFQLYPSGFGSYNWTPPSSTGSTFVNTVYMAGGTDAGTYYDEGTISVRVGGAAASVDYAEGSTPSDLASELASEINTAASGMVNASASGGTVTVKSAEGGPSSDLTISGSITPTNTNYTGSTSFSMVTTDMSGGAVTSGDVLYSFTIPDNGGYDVNGNLLTAADSVMGQWNYSYDNLNRLTMASAPATQPAGLDHYYAGVNSSGQQTWFYDAFGNRLSETWGSGGTATFTASPNLSFSATSNQVTGVNGQNVLYDAAGNVTWDGYNSYLYDAEGRLCAVDSTRNLSSANPGMFGYIYDADGIRVAKGTISQFTCDFNPSDTNYNHFTVKTSWVLGPGGEQVTEYSVNGGTSTWVHSNAFGDGKLLATYRDTNTYFALEDWLGSKRAEISADNSCGTAFRSLPYGNGLTPVTLAGYSSSCMDATEHHFTGKERDSESGNDYFGARYYASSMGRWLSPDPVKITGKRLADPQQLNLYGYARNNPFSYVDDDGKEVHILVTNVVVGRSTVNRYTRAELKANPELKQYTEKVPTYRVFITNDSGHSSMTQVTRDTVRKGPASETRGQYGTNDETPPGTYSVRMRTSEHLGFNTGISDLDHPGSGTVAGPDGERDSLLTHIGPGVSEGCLLLTGGADGRMDYATNLLKLWTEDVYHELGTNIYETVQDRNSPIPQTESPVVNTQIEQQQTQLFKP